MKKAPSVTPARRGASRGFDGSHNRRSIRKVIMLGLFSRRWLMLARVAGLAAGAVQAQPVVQVQDAWARATVPGQGASGAFMTLTAPQGATLEGVSSPAATAELHEMAMEGDVMRMRPLGSLALPAGRAVTLKPGGVHIMLLDLKAPLTAGASVPLTLRVRDAKGVESTVEVQAPVRALNAAGRGHGMDHGAHGR